LNQYDAEFPRTPAESIRNHLGALGMHLHQERADRGVAREARGRPQTLSSRNSRSQELMTCWNSTYSAILTAL
jgi:hypothetical protein